MQAMQHHDEGNSTVAKILYDLLLKLNPSDNQVIRYLLSALQKGLRPADA